MLPAPAELAANAFNTTSVVLAGRNSAHTWWTGIVGCLLFAWVFFDARLYADLTLQVFFIGTSIVGAWNWMRGHEGRELPVSHAPLARFVVHAGLAILAAIVYGALLRHYTNAYAPFLDSIVLAVSVLAQFLLMGRRIETWWCWLVVNTIAVPLYASRGLYVTAVLYAVFWVNAVVALRRWRCLLVASA